MNSGFYHYKYFEVIAPVPESLFLSLCKLTDVNPETAAEEQKLHQYDYLSTVISFQCSFSHSAKVMLF